MKRLIRNFLIYTAIGGSALSSSAQTQHSFELLPAHGMKMSNATAPFLAPKTYIPMGSHNSPLASEILANFNSGTFDANGQLVAGNFTTFMLPDTTTQTGGNPPASDGKYIGNQFMEYFTSTLNTIYLDSVIVGLSADSIPSRIVSYAYSDSTNSMGNPIPNIPVPALGSSQLLKSAFKFDDTIRFYTFNYKHKLLKTAGTVDPQSFFVSVTSLASVSSTPFFVNPPTSANRIRVLTDFFPESSQRAFDPTMDKMYQTSTRIDGQWVRYGAVAGVPVDTVNGTFLYPNIIMWAYVSDGISGVNDTKLEGNALAQNYPNPFFSQSTTIKYSLANESPVSLKLYNTLGVEVKTLVNDNEGAGEHQINFSGDNLPSGTYFYTLKAGEFTQTKSMVISK